MRNETSSMLLLRLQFVRLWKKFEFAAKICDLTTKIIKVKIEIIIDRHQTVRSRRRFGAIRVYILDAVCIPS